MTLRRYERYKDSGVEWLGAVPAHWDVMPLKRDIEFLTSGARGWADNYADEGDLFIRISNLTRDAIRLDLSDIQRVVAPDGAEVSRTQVRGGDVLFSITAYLGSVAVVPDGLGRAYVSQHVALVRPARKRLLPEWIAYVTASHVGKTYFETQGYGGTKIQLSLDDVARLLVTVPTLSEQIALVGHLDRETTKIDALIADQQRLIELLNEKRQAAIAHAVTKGLHSSAPMKDSGVEWLGRVPSHWSIARLGSIFEQIDERGDDSLPVLSVSIHDGVSDSELDDAELDRKVTRSDDRTKYKRVVAGDLVYNMMRAWQGGFGTVAVDGMVSPAYVVARPRGVVPTAFIERVLRTPNAVEEMRRHSRGVTDFRLRLYWDEFKNIVVALPPRTEAEAIDKRVTDIEAKMAEVIAAAEDCIRMLQERRSALISAAVTGQIDVRQPSPAESTSAAHLQPHD